MEYATLVGKASDSWEFYWLNLSGDYVKQTARKLWEDECIVHDCRNKETFRQIFHGMLESPAPQQGQEYEHSCRIQDLFHQLLAELLFERKSPVGNSAENILDHIRQNYASAVTLDDLSRRFFLSQNQLIRVFRKRTGYTPYGYLKHYRMAKACELLSGTSFPVGRIGELVGYRNQSHFIAQFHALYGMTPGEYRVKWSPEQQVEIRTGDG